jgi:hypothetical protein
VEVTADGYYSKVIRGVRIFAGSIADLPINMIPEAAGEADYPRGNVNAII